MSRSYKKSPVLKNNGKSRFWKQRANRMFRRIPICETPFGKSAYHRKYTESWDICDDIYKWSRAAAAADWEQEEKQLQAGALLYKKSWHSRYATKEQFLHRQWGKFMRRK